MSDWNNTLETGNPVRSDLVARYMWRSRLNSRSVWGYWLNKHLTGSVEKSPCCDDSGAHSHKAAKHVVRVRAGHTCQRYCIFHGRV